MRLTRLGTPVSKSFLNSLGDQLSPVERDSLSRLSVFRGGFTAEAARAIASARLPVLGALADKSLLRKEEARIFMHPLVQQLAELRLSASDHRESTERAHALYFHRLAGAASTSDRKRGSGGFTTC